MKNENLKPNFILEKQVIIMENRSRKLKKKEKKMENAQV